MATAAQTATWRNNEVFWTAALKANPEIALAENNLGYIDQTKGRYEQAFRRYQHAVQIRPRYVEAHINLGNMYMLKNQMDEALKHYRTAIDIRPDFEQSYVNLGTALAVRGDFAAAEANFRTALSLDPGYLEAYWKLGDLLCRQKRLDQGIDVLRTAIKIAPAYYPAWRTLGQALANDPQRRDEAIKCYSVLLGQPETARDAAEDPPGYLYYVKRQPRDGVGILGAIPRRGSRFAARADHDGLGPRDRSGRIRSRRKQGRGAGNGRRQSRAAKVRRSWLRWLPRTLNREILPSRPAPSSRPTACQSGRFPRRT